MVFFFFFNDTATTEIYTLSLHDALPISRENFPTDTVVAIRSSHEPTQAAGWLRGVPLLLSRFLRQQRDARDHRSEEHTSELQSLAYLVCRLLLEKKNQLPSDHHHPCARA